MEGFNLSVELKELPLVMLEENRGQIPDVPKNPRKITKERYKALIESHKQSPEMEKLNEMIVFPFNGKYVVISGNHRLKARRELKWTKSLCKVLGEDTPKNKLREYVIKENMQYAQNDDEIIKEAWNLKELVGWDMPFDVMAKKVADYSRKIESPVYTPTGLKIDDVRTLYDDTEVQDIEAHIAVADIPDDVRDMLMKAAQRFRRFDFGRVAEYYSQCTDPVVRALMERAAMVIVDFKQAIENGFVVLAEDIMNEYLSEYEDEV